MFSETKNEGVTGKLITGFVAVAALAAVIGVIAVDSLGTMGAAVTRIYSNGVGGVAASGGIQLYARDMACAYRDMVIYSDPASLELHQRTVDEAALHISADLDRLEEMAVRLETKELIREARGRLNVQTAEGAKFGAAAKAVQADVPDSVLAGLRSLREHDDALEEAAASLADMFDNVAASINDEAGALYKNAVSMLIALVVAGVVLSVLIGFFLAKSIGGRGGQGQGAGGG